MLVETRNVSEAVYRWVGHALCSGGVGDTQVGGLLVWTRLPEYVCVSCVCLG